MTLTSIQFINDTTSTVKVFWLDYGGQRVLYATLAAGQSYIQGSYLTHPWVITNSAGNCLEIYLPIARPGVARIRVQPSSGKIYWTSAGSGKIQRANLDGWSSFVATPPFPDYTSGHSTFSGAASTVLASFYGTDNIAFTTGSDFLPGVFRSFTTFSAAADEAALSRLYGGIHYRSANDDGLTSGIVIGAWTFDNYLQPKGNHSRK